MAGEKRRGEEVVVSRVPSKSAKGQLEQRAAWCLSYVRALNTQFAAWVEQQKREHPDELWEGGVEDYLKHATKLVTDYRDVVDWLKSGAQAQSPLLESARRAPADSPVVLATTLAPEVSLSSPDFMNSSAFGSSAATTAATYCMTSAALNPGSRSGSDPCRGAGSPTGIAAMARGVSVAAFRSPFPVPSAAIMPSEADKKDAGADPGRANFPPTDPVAGPVSTFPPGGFGFAAVRSPMPLPNFATRPASIDTERKDVQGSGEQEDEQEEPPSPSFKSTEEKGIQTVHQSRAKLYFQESSGEGTAKTWKDLGSGQVLLKCRESAPKGSKDAKATIVFRNEVGKILLNALLYTGMKVNPVKRDLTLVLTVAGPAVNGQTTAEPRRQACLLRLPKEDDAKALADALQSYCPV